MSGVTKDKLLTTIGDFTWFWGQDFFIETSYGNFHWKDPDYGGDNTMTLFDGDLDAFGQYLNLDFGRDKGFHEIRHPCGENFTLILNPAES